MRMVGTGAGHGQGALSDECWLSAFQVTRKRTKRRAVALSVGEGRRVGIKDTPPPKQNIPGLHLLHLIFSGRVK